MAAYSWLNYNDGVKPSTVRGALKVALVRMGGGNLVGGSHLSVEPGVQLLCRGGSISIGDKTYLRRGVMLVAQPGRISLGRNVSINPYSILYGDGGIDIGNDVRIAAHVVIVAADHGFADRTRPIWHQPMTTKGIVIEDDVWIGAGVQILDGSHLSRGCIIGAGAVVKVTTESFGVYGGVPARLLRMR